MVFFNKALVNPHFCGGYVAGDVGVTSFSADSARWLWIRWGKEDESARRLRHWRSHWRLRGILGNALRLGGVGRADPHVFFFFYVFLFIRDARGCSKGISGIGFKRLFCWCLKWGDIIEYKYKWRVLFGRKASVTGKGGIPTFTFGYWNWVNL